MLLVTMYKTKEKLLVFFIILMVTFSAVYVFISHIQDNYKNVQWSGERCASELKSVKYQLNVVTEYKNKLDKLLIETQKAHEADKAKFKDMMENCVAMKQQSNICQMQFEDLQTECQRVKQNYDKVMKEMDKPKSR